MDEKAVSHTAVAALPIVVRARLGELAALAAFIAVETAAELLRRHMVDAAEGVFSSPAAALVATSFWTYLAHTRYAFRRSTRTSLSTLPPYVVVCLGLAVARASLDRGASLPGDLALFAAATLLKFGLLRLWLWPFGPYRRVEVRQSDA